MVTEQERRILRYHESFSSNASVTQSGPNAAFFSLRTSLRSLHQPTQTARPHTEPGTLSRSWFYGEDIL